MAPRTTQWLQNRTWDNPRRALRGSSWRAFQRNDRFRMWDLWCRVWGLEFGASYFGFGISGLVIRVSCFPFPGSGFRVSGPGFWTCCFGFRVSGFGSRVSDFFGFRVSGFGLWVMGFGKRGSGFRGAELGVHEHCFSFSLLLSGLDWSD